MNSFTVDGKALSAEPWSRHRYTAEEILTMAGIPEEGVRALRHYFVDGERQQYWPFGWGDEIGIEDGDRFEVEYGPRAKPPRSL